jgi:hypothetical protein
LLFINCHYSENIKQEETRDIYHEWGQTNQAVGGDIGGEIEGVDILALLGG